MTDQEISLNLALAIGWKPEQMRGDPVIGLSVNKFSLSKRYAWPLFDYRDPAVIWPIAERYNRFPYALRDQSGAFTGKWNVLVGGGEYTTDTAAKAVALAVIGGAK